MSKVIWLFSFVFIVIAGKAQYTGYKPLADAGSFKEQFARASLQTNSIKSDFVQEKNLSLLSEKMISKGKFWFKKEALLRMEYIEPFQYLMIINNSNVLIRDGQKENRVNTKSSKLFRQINDIMVDCVKGSALANPDFTVRVFDGKQAFLVELSPVAKNVKEYFRTILVTVDKKDYTANSIEMNEQSGDNTVIHFINKELNVNIPDALFAIR
ncbi:MAG TPA: outer membrane lipoprotein carrier protein LolA [Puia sp.]|nr:outer membrane lipoprotein carrier protein LolA [Puia sp.]